MNDRHRKILHQCWSEFRKDLEPKNLLPELTSVVNVTDAREVLEKGARIERVDKLVTEILPRRGNNAFNVFVEGLKKTQPHLAVTLKNAEIKMMEEELKNERASSAMRSNQVDEATEALEKERKEHEETQRRLEEITRQNEALIENYRKEREVIEKELINEKEGCVKLKKQVLETEEAFEKKQQENKEKQKVIEELGRQQEKLDAESKAEIKKLSEKNNSYQEKIKGLNSTLKNLKKESDKMEKEKKEQKSKLNAKEQELAKLKDQLKKEESENKKVSEEVEKLKEDNDQLRKDLDAEKKKLEETEEELRAETKAKGDALNELEKLREGCGRVFNYKKDFDRCGVIYAMGMNFGANRRWVNPSKSGVSTRVSASRSSDEVGSATDLLERCHKQGKISGTKNVKESWWCVALSEKYSLYLTHYTLRHGLGNGGSFLRNWQLEGSFDGSTWEVLKKHHNDSKLCEPSSYTATWPIEGEVGAYRFFRVFQKGKNSSNEYGIYLSGIELYGVLMKGYNS